MMRLPDTRRLLLYGLVGVTSNGVAFVLYIVLVDFAGIRPVLSMTTVYAAAMTVGFWGNRHLTFAHGGSVLGTFPRYLIVYSLGYLLNLIIILVGVDHLHYSHVWTQAFAVVAVAAFLFPALRSFVFPPSERAAPAAER
jgi:putative flippase GtrA